MKKKIIYTIISIIAIFVIVTGCLYAIDMYRMKNNEPVVFSTWGYDYAPPVEIPKPPVLRLNNKDGSTEAICLTGTHSWNNGKMGIVSDYPHPVKREYNKENILEIANNKELFTTSPDVKIKSVKLYRSNIPEILKYDILFTDKSIIFDITDCKEYIAEIITEYEQGTVSYCLKVVEQN